MAPSAAADALQPFPFGWEHHKDRHCVWIVSPNGYVHSRAFEDVALGLHHAFAELGGRAPLVTEPSSWRGRMPIVYGANLLPPESVGWLPRGSILVNLEQVSRESSWINGKYLSLLRQFPVLDYSPRNRRALADLGVAHAGLLGIGYQEKLTRIEHAAEKDIDVLFYGSVNERRHRLLTALKAAGLNVAHLFGLYGAERDAFIARSKVVLNIHHFDAQVFEIVRVSFLLANRVCVLTEGSASDPDIGPYAAGMAVAPFDQLVERCRALVADAGERERLAEAGFSIMKSVSQAEILRQIADGRPVHAVSPHMFQ